MTRGSEERIINGSFSATEDLEVDLTKLVKAVVSKQSVPMRHQRSQHLPLILREVGQGHKDEGHEVGRYRNGPCMLVSEPLLALSIASSFVMVACSSAGKPAIKGP